MALEVFALGPNPLQEKRNVPAPSPRPSSSAATEKGCVRLESDSSLQETAHRDRSLVHSPPNCLSLPPGCFGQVSQTLTHTAAGSGPLAVPRVVSLREPTEAPDGLNSRGATGSDTLLRSGLSFPISEVTGLMCFLFCFALLFNC